MQSESESLRLFVAIRVPDSVKAALGSVQTELAAALPEKSTAWTRPDAMHLTLRFLGRVEDRRVAELMERLQAGLAGFGNLDLLCERLGCFPDVRFPKVVWAGVHDTGDRLQTLRRRVVELAAEFAEKPAEKRFEGHITLARPKSITRRDAARLAQFVEAAVERQFGLWSCSEVELVRSELLPQGSRYTTLAAFRLSARDTNQY
jgi:2'-5' RNA ligase